MEVRVLETLLRDAKLLRVRGQIAISDTHALFHHLAKLACDGQVATALAACGLDEQHVAAHRSPGQTSCHTGDFRSGCCLEVEARLAQVLADDFGCHFNGVNIVRRDTDCNLTQHRTDLSLKITNSSL